MVYAPKTGIRLPGTSGNCISTPDDASLQITTDISLVTKVALDDWTPSTDASLLGKWWSSATQATYLLVVRSSTGLLGLYLRYGTGGSDFELSESTIAPSVNNGDILTVGVNREASSGDISFWTKNGNYDWQQLGATISGGTFSLQQVTGGVIFGAHGTTGNLGLWPGTIYSAQIYSGVGDNSAPGLGTLVAECETSKCKPRYRDSTGKVWTLNGSDSTMEKV